MKRALALAIVVAAGVMTASVDSARPPQLLTFTVSHWQPGGRLMQQGGLCIARPDGAIARPDGANAVRLLPSPAGRDTDFGAAWSRDGSYLAFSRWFKRNRLTDIVIADARGRVIRTLYSRAGPDGSFELDPSWSPDGRRLAFARSWARTGIWFINRDGSGLRQFIQGQASIPCGHRTARLSPSRRPARAFKRPRTGPSTRSEWTGASDVRFCPAPPTRAGRRTERSSRS